MKEMNEKEREIYAKRLPNELPQGHAHVLRYYSRFNVWKARKKKNKRSFVNAQTVITRAHLPPNAFSVHQLFNRFLFQLVCSLFSISILGHCNLFGVIQSTCIHQFTGEKLHENSFFLLLFVFGLFLFRRHRKFIAHSFLFCYVRQQISFCIRFAHLSRSHWAKIKQNVEKSTENASLEFVVSKTVNSIQIDYFGASNKTFPFLFRHFFRSCFPSA